MQFWHREFVFVPNRSDFSLRCAKTRDLALVTYLNTSLTQRASERRAHVPRVAAAAPKYEFVRGGTWPRCRAKAAMKLGR